MKLRTIVIAGLSGAAASGAISLSPPVLRAKASMPRNMHHALDLLDEGTKTLRYETFAREKTTRSVLELSRNVSFDRSIRNERIAPKAPT
jgi:hypothetical protein